MAKTINNEKDDSTTTVYILIVISLSLISVMRILHFVNFLPGIYNSSRSFWQYTTI